MHPPDENDEAIERPKAQPARPTLELLTRSTFGLYFFGKLLWATGVWVFTVTAAILMFSLTSSAFMVGVVTFFQYFPLLVLAPVSGAWADRGNPKRQAAIGRVIMAVGAGALALQMAAQEPSSSTIAFLLAAALSVGLGDALGAPATQTVLPRLVRPSELATAVELDAIPFTLARAVGPVLGAVLTTVLSTAFAFGYVAFVSLVFAGILLRLNPERSGLRRQSKQGDGSVAEGFRYLREQPALALILLGVTTVGFGVDPVVTLSPSLVSELGGAPSDVGLLASSFGVGAGVLLLLLRRIRQAIGVERVAPMGLWLLAGAILGCSFVPDVRSAIVLMGLGGAGYAMAITSLTTLLQSTVADEMRGRIMALWSVTYFGSRPIAAAINGGIADLVSVRSAFVFAALTIAAGSWAIRPRRALGGVREPR